MKEMVFFRTDFKRLESQNCPVSKSLLCNHENCSIQQNQQTGELTKHQVFLTTTTETRANRARYLKSITYRINADFVRNTKRLISTRKSSYRQLLPVVLIQLIIFLALTHTEPFKSISNYSLASDETWSNFPISSRAEL